MNKIQKKITERIESGFYKSTPSVKITEDILSILDQENVRIVKEIELPNPPYIVTKSTRDSDVNFGYIQARDDMLERHNESLERLI